MEIEFEVMISQNTDQLIYFLIRFVTFYSIQTGRKIYKGPLFQFFQTNFEILFSKK
jgi:hypothetical protein